MTDYIDAAREAYSARDWRWQAALYGIVFAFLAFQAGRIAETNQALSAARQLMADRQPHLEKAALEKAKGEVVNWFETAWPCVAWGPDVSIDVLDCVIRERRTP